MDTALEVAAEGDVAMEDVEAKSESAARVEEEKNARRSPGSQVLRER